MSFAEVMPHKALISMDGADKEDSLFARTADILGRLGPDTAQNRDTILEGVLSIMGGRFALFVETCSQGPIVRAGINLPQGMAGDIEAISSLFSRPPETGNIIIMENGPARLPPDPILEKYGITTLMGAPVAAELQPGGILWIGEPRTMEFAPGHIHAMQCLAAALGHQVRLARACRYQGVAELAAKTAHDLNNILTGLVTYPELMLLQLDPGSSLREPVSFIHESGVQASDLVQDFLFLTRPRSYTPVPIDPAPVARAYFSGYTHAALKVACPHVRFSLKVKEDLDRVRISDLFLTRIITIVVAHAAHGAPPCSRVTLTLFPGSAGGVCLDVCDDGPALSREDLSNIFHPFYTRKKMGRPGSGLGFPVIQKIVKDHGGKIRVETSTKKGNFVEIRFPASGI